jgi:excisionase family DNA binding protein
MTKVPMLYTPQEVAEIMSISRSQVYNLMNSNQLESVHIGRSRRITMDQIHEFVGQLTSKVEHI